MAKAVRKLEASQTYAITRALADPYRFAILQQIAATSDLPSSDLFSHDPFRPATVAHHLRELREAGLIEIARPGPHPTFKIARSVWRAYINELADFIRV